MEIRRKTARNSVIRQKDGLSHCLCSFRIAFRMEIRRKSACNSVILQKDDLSHCGAKAGAVHANGRGPAGPPHIKEEGGPAGPPSLVYCRRSAALRGSAPGSPSYDSPPSASLSSPSYFRTSQERTSSSFTTASLMLRTISRRPFSLTRPSEKGITIISWIDDGSR